MAFLSDLQDITNNLKLSGIHFFFTTFLLSCETGGFFSDNCDNPSAFLSAILFLLLQSPVQQVVSCTFMFGKKMTEEHVLF